jgi:hypothetical protein
MPASDGIGFVLGLEDALTGPARAETSALKGLEGQIGSTEKRLRSLSTVQGESAGLFSSMGEHLLKSAGGSALLAGGLAAVGFAAAEAVEKVAEIGYESLKFAIEAAEFKHNTELAYAAVKGTAAEGEEVFAQVDKLARTVHLPAEQAHKLASDLMVQGLEDTKAIGAVITADAALIRTGQVEGAAKLRKIVERSLASGHFDPGRLGGGKKGSEASGRALAGLGVHLPELIEDIAKKTGQSVAQVKIALQKGKIDTEVGIAALTEAIDKSPIGRAASGKFDFGDFFTDLQNKWRSIVQDIDLGPIEQGLVDISVAINGIDGSGVKGAFQTIVDGIGDAITEATIFGQGIEISFLTAELAAKPLLDVIEQISSKLGLVSAVGDIAKRAALTAVGLEGFAGGVAVTPPPALGPSPGAIGGPAQPAAGFAPPALELPPNAAGGRVQPASGEMLASVAPGEIILPAAQANQGSGHTVHVDVGGIHLTGGDPHMVAALLESQLADVFERVSLELGR